MGPLKTRFCEFWRPENAISRNLGNQSTYIYIQEIHHQTVREIAASSFVIGAADISAELFIMFLADKIQIRRLRHYALTGSTLIYTIGAIVMDKTPIGGGLFLIFCSFFFFEIGLVTSLA